MLPGLLDWSLATRSRAGITALLAVLAALLAMQAALGCGDAGAVAPDGGGERATELVVLGQVSIGLAPTETRTLRVRYTDESGAPIAGGAIAWSFVIAEGEELGGATLSAATTVTDDDGRANIELTAGVDEVSFRVAAEAALAPRATFYAAVSAGGFLALEVTPVHRGFRDALAFDRVEIRLYRALRGPCAELLAAAAAGTAPESPFPPMSTTGFDAPLRLENLAVEGDYTLLGWATAGSELVVALGCAELAAAQIPPGLAEVELELTDRAPALPVTLALASQLDLTPLAAAIATAGADAPWQVLPCPAGPGQLALDCLIDALADDDALDCATAPGALAGLAADLAAERGDPDEAGCRPAVDGAQTTLDGALTTALEDGGFPDAATRAGVVASRAAILGAAILRSRLQRESAGVLVHRLDDLAFTDGAASISVGLAASTLPVVSAPAATAIDGAGVATIAPHAFTLHFGRGLAVALRELALAPRGLSGSADELGSALFAAADDGEGGHGCAAVSALTCARAEAAPTCALAACAAAAAALDVRLGAGAALLDGAGLDLRLTGTAALRDDDVDLVADALLGGDGTGSWAATFTLATGAEVPSTGSFTATVP